METTLSSNQQASFFKSNIFLILVVTIFTPTLYIVCWEGCAQIFPVTAFVDPMSFAAGGFISFLLKLAYIAAIFFFIKKLSSSVIVHVFVLVVSVLSYIILAPRIADTMDVPRSESMQKPTVIQYDARTGTCTGSDSFCKEWRAKYDKSLDTFFENQ